MYNFLFFMLLLNSLSNTVITLYNINYNAIISIFKYYILYLGTFQLDANIHVTQESETKTKLDFNNNRNITIMEHELICSAKNVEDVIHNNEKENKEQITEENVSNRKRTLQRKRNTRLRESKHIFNATNVENKEGAHYRRGKKNRKRELGRKRIAAWRENKRLYSKKKCR